MLTNKSFISNYLHNYHAKRAQYLGFLFQKLQADKEELLKEKESKHRDFDDLMYVLKIDIRQNLFHAIETLFDFMSLLDVNALSEPDRDLGRLLLNSSDQSSYLMCDKIKKSSIAQEWLDEEFQLYGRSFTKFSYIFHFAFSSEDLKYGERVKAVKKLIVFCAKEFDDRKEYNSYKHSLRAVPNAFSMQVMTVDEPKLEFELKTDTSVAFWARKGKDKTLATEPIHFKSLDTARDLNISVLVSRLISNIVTLRRKHFGYGDEKYEPWLPLSKEVEEALKVSVEVDDVRFESRYDAPT